MRSEKENALKDAREKLERVKLVLIVERGKLYGKKDFHEWTLFNDSALIVDRLIKELEKEEKEERDARIQRANSGG